MVCFWNLPFLWSAILMTTLNYSPMARFNQLLLPYIPFVLEIRNYKVELSAKFAPYINIVQKKIQGCKKSQSFKKCKWMYSSNCDDFDFYITTYIYLHLQHIKRRKCKHIRNILKENMKMQWKHYGEKNWTFPEINDVNKTTNVSNLLKCRK